MEKENKNSPFTPETQRGIERVRKMGEDLKEKLKDYQKPSITFVYVIYDPLLEKVLCVHSKPNKTCDVCGKKEYNKRRAYQLEEHKRKIKIF